jgi:cytochrome b6-f complex iron-sulfur subunit
LSRRADGLRGLVEQSRTFAAASPLHDRPSMNQSDDLPVPTRREFCIRTCQAASLVALGAAMPACGGSSTSPSSAPPLPSVSGSLAGRTLTITVDAASPLAAVGGAAIVTASTGTYLVARTAQATCTTVTAACTHEGCAVTGFANSLYVCPCHGAEFSTSGAVVQGPAVSALRQFPTTFANNVVTINV